jgi:hypothetical protein
MLIIVRGHICHVSQARVNIAHVAAAHVEHPQHGRRETGRLLSDFVDIAFDPGLFAGERLLQLARHVSVGDTVAECSRHIVHGDFRKSLKVQATLESRNCERQ